MEVDIVLVSFCGFDSQKGRTTQKKRFVCISIQTQVQHALPGPTFLWATPSPMSAGPRSCPAGLEIFGDSLQEIDKIMGDSAQNASFDIVRLAQSVSWNLDTGTNV